MTPAWRRYARFFGPRVDDDVDDELAFHVEMRTREYIAAGMSESDARRAAEQRFGHRGTIQGVCRTIGLRRQRRMQRAQTIDALAQDLRYGGRSLLRQKAWTAVALLTMALGIGASTAVFSVVNSLLLNPLPYRDADRIAMVWRADAKSTMMIAPEGVVLDALKAETRLFEGVEEMGTADATLTGRGDAVSLHASTIQADFLAFAGLQPILGRAFVPEETQPGGEAVALISEDLWRQQFGASPNVVGQRITLDDKSYRVVGVAPSALQLPMMTIGDTKVWLPLVKDSSGRRTGSLVATRLRKGVTFETATKRLNDIVGRNYVDAASGPMRFDVRLVRPADLVQFKPSLYLLGGAVTLLLLVSCANVAHLLLARGATRERELAVRAALGAGRWRLTRQLLTESSILAVIGCVGGVALGYAGIRVLTLLRPDSLGELSRAHIDGHVLTAAIAMSAFAGLAFGCIAALHAVRRTSAEALRTSSTSSGPRRTHRLRSLLVVTEMALSALLLVGAALLVRSVVNLQHVDRGFNSSNLYDMKLSFSSARFPTGQERRAFIDRIVDAASHIPGVVSVTTATATPPAIGGAYFAPIEVEGGAAVPSSSMMPLNYVANNYFAVLGIRVEGSTFGPEAAKDGDAIINRAFAQRFWPGQSAIGRRFRFRGGKGQKPDEGWQRIVGIADNVPSVSSGPGDAKPFTYKAASPNSAASQSVIAVRARDGIDPTSALQRIVMSMDTRLAPPPVSTVDRDLARTVATQRFTMILLTTFAIVAVVLSAVGLYGVISYVVVQRTREIGIRVALGAAPSNIAAAIVLRGLALSGAGLAIGLAVAIWGTALIKSVLFGVTGTDVPSYTLAGATLLIVSAAACIVPMRRAMGVDPAIAMRGD